MRANLLKRVKDEFDWDSYLFDHFDVKRTSTAERRICCFVCGDRDYKLYVNPERRKFQCFKCGFTSGKYDVFSFVSKAEGITRPKAIARLVREYAAVTPEDDEIASAFSDVAPTIAESTPIKVLRGLPKAAQLLEYPTQENSRFWNYLISRGLTPEEIRMLRIHYIAKADCPIFDSNGKRRGNIGNRVLWPIYGGDRDLVSWQARVIDPKYPGNDKYITAPDSELSKTFWPYVKPKTKRVVLVEGVLDAVSVRRTGADVYATFSKKISMSQLLLLKHWGVEEVVVLWDKKDARKDIERAVEELKLHVKRVFVSHMSSLPANQDAGNMLADPEGTDKLKRCLESPDIVDTYDPLDYARWSLTFGTT